ncbi:MAG: TlpA disulfide reductase family protein [Thermodesulfobacteriota bacterium]
MSWKMKYASTLLSAVLLVLITMLVAGCGQEKEKYPAKATVNSPAPNFTLTDIQGQRWRLADLRGKLVFINFWATWCPPCQEELPSMEALHRGMDRGRFQMLTILSNDNPELARMLAGKMGLTFPILTDPEARAAKQYGITGVPETFIIDSQGILREKIIGPRNWNSQAAWQMLAKYLPPSADAAAHSKTTR